MNTQIFQLKRVMLISVLVMQFVISANAAEMVAETMARGEHGGRLLEQDGFSVELAIFEDGVPPEYRAWASSNSRQLLPSEWQLEVALSRLGGRLDRFQFAPREDYLTGDGEVTEPHSFDVAVTARYQGRSYEWQYESHEGRMQMADTMAAAMGLSTAIASGQTLHQTQLLFGKITPDPRQVSHITARYPGLIRSVLPALGDFVAQGELLATVEANDSLQRYEIHAPIAGLVVDIHANPGEFAGEQSLLTIANYSNVWADLNVFPGDTQFIRPGQHVELRMGTLSATSAIRYLNPGEGLSPHVIAKVPLANADLVWTPGLMVEADVTIDQFDVALAVENRALQSFRDWQVVFIKIGDEYEIRPLELGRSDRRFTEVLGGLQPGDEYVVANSYLIKADLEKSGASHDH